MNLKESLPDDKCHEILHYIKDQLPENADVVVVVFTENERRNFGTGCLNCSGQALIETATDLINRDHDDTGRSQSN